MTTGTKKVVRVSGRSLVKETASSIVRMHDDGNTDIELHSIGASSANQMLKILATASIFFASQGRTLAVRHGYGHTMIDGGERTVMVARLVIE